LMNEETQTSPLTVGHGLGIWLLLLVAEVIAAGISMIFFGFHVTVIVSEALVFLLPFSFFYAAGYSLRHTLTFPQKLGLGFWISAAAATFFLLLVISDITGYVHQLIPMPEEQRKALLKVLVAESWPEYLFRLFGAGILAGFCEEFAFRGFLQSVFSKRLGGLKGMVLTAFLFAVMHLDPWTLVGIFILGMFLGYLVLLTGNLWVAIFVHAFSNILSFSMAFFIPDMGTDFSFTFPPYVTLVCTFLLIVSLKLIRTKYQERMSSASLVG
jgi:membrane protease YdiL (CAAX protease family)